VPSARADPAEREDAKARALLGVEPELVVNGLHGPLDVGRAHDAGDADRRRRDDLDVDPGLGEGLEHVRGDAGMALHACADERHLCDFVVDLAGPRPDVGGELVEDGLRGREIALRERERDVGRAVGGDVLHDHVDVHAGVGEHAEDTRGDTRRIRYGHDRRLRFGDVVGDAGHDRLLEH
jgi:hypothetical protein